MRKWPVCALAVVWACAVLGCSEGGAGKTDNEKKFQERYKQYSARFYEEMTNKVQTMEPLQITQEASRVWDEVFGPNKALVLKRAEEILKELDQCPAIQEDQYNEVAVATRDAGAAPDKAWKTVAPGKPPLLGALPDETAGTSLKQFRWTPTGEARLALDNWLKRILQEPAFAMHQIMAVNVSPVWDAIDRNVDHPKLCLRQGPRVFQVDLSRNDDYYQVEKIRWLQSKTMGPGSVPAAEKPPAAGEAPAPTPPPAAIPAAPAAPAK